MKNIIIVSLFVLTISFSYSQDKMVLPTVDDKEFVWKMGDGTYKTVEFLYGIKDEKLDNEILNSVVMNCMVQSKFKLKIKNSFIAKKLTILKTDSGYSAIVKYLGKNAYGTEIESTSYFSFTNEEEPKIEHLMTM